jgi:hypothetical protein
MALFNLTVALEEGVVFIFGSWICIANGFGEFGSHLTNPRELEASMPTSSRDIDELTDNLGEIQISDLIGNCESESGSNSAPTHDGSELESLFQLHITTAIFGRRYNVSPYLYWKRTWMIYFNSDSDRSSRCNIDMPQVL